MIVLVLGTLILVQTVFLAWLISKNAFNHEEPVLRVSDLPTPAEDLPTKSYVDSVHRDVAQQTHDSFVKLSEALLEVVDEQEEWVKGRISTLIARVEASEDLANSLLDVLDGLTERMDIADKKIDYFTARRQQVSNITNVSPPRPPVEVVVDTVERMNGPVADSTQPEEEPTQSERAEEHNDMTAPETSSVLREARGDDDPMITDLRALPFDADPEVRGDETLDGVHDIPPMTGDYEIMGSTGPSDAQRRAADRARRGVAGFPRRR